MDSFHWGEQYLLSVSPGQFKLATDSVIAAIIIAAFIALIMAVIIWNFGSLWFQAWMSNADVAMFSLVGMYFGKYDRTSS